MFYVYSTCTCDGYYVVYDKRRPHDLPTVAKRPDGSKIKILIKGGHGVSQQKTFYTPRGVVTNVNDADMEILMANKSFQRHMKAGHISYEKKAVDTEKKVSDMAQKDGSAPVTPEDFVKSPNSDADTKVYKRKGDIE